MLDVLRSGPPFARPAARRVRAGVRARVGAAFASAVSSGTAGLHLALRARRRRATATRSITTPFSFVASANVVVYERARPVFADIDPVTFNLDPDAAAAAVTERTTALLPVHVFGYPADLARVRAARAADRRGRVRGARAFDADGVPVGGRGTRRCSGSTPNKQLTTGEGGMVTTADAGLKERFDSERNQGRAPDMDWLDHDRLGFNYRLSEIACALGIAQLERLDELLAGRARVAASYAQALADIEGVELPCSETGGVRRGWFVYVVQLPRGVDRDVDRSRARLRAASRASPTSPRST